MSMPNIPDINPDICLCLKDVINLLLSSIALQETALSNLINAESEKLQSIVNEKECCYSIKELIALNVSIEKVMNEVSTIESLLVTKLKYINQIEVDKDSDECCNDCEDDSNSCFEKCCCENELEDQEEQLEFINEDISTCECECNNILENKEFESNHNTYTTDSSSKKSSKKVNNNTYNQDSYNGNYNKISNMINKIIR